MRISDWSSDVCSSDLGRGKVLRAFDGQDETALGRFGQEKLAWIERETTRRNAELYVDVSKHFIHGLHLPFVRALPDLGKIGRASCRERVCQYVVIPVVAGSIKKKKKNETTTRN